MRHLSHFAERLAASAPRVEPGTRRWVFVPYDQLSDAMGPLAEAPPGELGVVLVESPNRATQRPYHPQKLALVLANLRHFALEQAARGVAVRHVVSPGDYAAALRPLAAELGPLEVMEPAERLLRVDLAPLQASGALRTLPHAGWLSTEADFAAIPGPPWRMDAFYRQVRRRTGVLMDARGKPVGGRFSFDAENRKPWPGDPPAPEPPRFTPDAITQEVGDLVRRRFATHQGTLDLSTLPATAEDAARLWAWARTECLNHFGPYEDALSRHSRGLFHSRVAPLLNLHRLLPQQVLGDVLATDLPLASKEGFVRQILGWREFVRHVHRATDGFRQLPGLSAPTAVQTDHADAPGAPNHLGATAPLPAAWWGAPSGLACLDDVVRGVWAEGYTHHIARLMVLSNLATLLGCDPRALTDWFWVAFTDAYDWVVEPNVLGMGTFAAGDVMTTKPYVSGAAYLARMGDHCAGCAFDPAKTCPITPLYWAFLHRNDAALRPLQRMHLPLASARKRSTEQQRHDHAVHRAVLGRLAEGAVVTPGWLKSEVALALGAGRATGADGEPSKAAAALEGAHGQIELFGGD